MRKNFAFTAAVLICLAALPAAAQTPFYEVTLRAVRMQTRSDTGFHESLQNFTGQVDSATGFGLGATFYVTDSLAIETSGSYIKPDFNVQLFDAVGPTSTQSLTVIPLTLGAQLHFGNRQPLDFYVGAGGAYVLFGNVDSTELANRDVGDIKIDDAGGWMVNGGANISLARSFALNVDVKYLGVKPKGSVQFVRGEFTDRRDVDLRPLLISAGVTWRF